jgi:metal-dependent amidase/aminoacylase/carboxypeptidase family protein
MNNIMRKLITGYVENYKDKLCSLTDMLYENPEPSFFEDKSVDAISGMLEEENFNIKRDIAGIKNSFIAEYTSEKKHEHPKVAYICQYDAVESLGHIKGNNISCAINLGAAIGLKRSLEEQDGCAVLIGCPAEEKYPSKIVMKSQGIFNDIDAVIMGKAGEKTCESGTSTGMNLIEVVFRLKDDVEAVDCKSALSPLTMLFNLIDNIKCEYKNSSVNGIITNGGESINIIPESSKCLFMVKSTSKDDIDIISKNIIEFADFVSKYYKCEHTYTISDASCLPLKTSSKLSAIICHNLKEKGILEIHGPVTLTDNLDTGNISHMIPCAVPVIGISKDSVKYSTKEFADCTVTPYAKQNMIKAASALALTGYDIICNPEILKEGI